MSLSGFSTGVSLHCHTQQSKEILDFIPYYAGKIPIVADFFRRELDRHESKNGWSIDFARAYWNPPVPPRAVLDSESEQIERTLGLSPIISITDHDHIGACSQLKAIYSDREMPISLEWTVPFEKGFFHLGVHNLPHEESEALWALLRGYTLNPAGPIELADLLEKLSGYEETLLVLNHPLWDIERIGQEPHLSLLTRFLKQHGSWIHAIEINGYRSWAENKRVIALADEYGYPLVSGGDRHGCDPNAMLNLTTANTFSEFAVQIRSDRMSEIAVMPAYREPLVIRMLEAAADVLRYYPGYPKGQRFWTDRIFWTLDDQTVRPLSSYWGHRGPVWVRASLSIMRLLGSRGLRPAMKTFLPREEEVGL